MRPPTAKASVATGQAATLAILVSLATFSGAVPTSVLVDSKETHGHREVTASPGLNQLTTDDAMYGDDRAGPSNPQKRGVNPLLYREAELRNDFSGNSIPQNGVWEDVDLPLPGMPYPLELFDAPIEPGPFDRFNQQQQQQLTYDVLQNLLSRQPSPYNPLFIGRPVSGGYPVRMHGSGGAYGTERKKRTLATGPAKSYSHQMRLKRSTGKLSPAEVFSLLTLMDSRDPYRPLSPLPEYISDDQANDVLAYAPNGMYPDVALPLALEQLLGARGGGGAGGDGYAYDDAGEWMNGWTEPSVDYMGIPMTDLDALGALNDGKTVGSINAYMPQKRFMVSKKKRSVTQAPSPAAVVGCKPGDASCGAQSHQQGGIIQAAA